MKLKLTKEELSWSLYDCANSAYIMMLTAMIPPYIATIGQEFSGLSSASTTANWSFVQSGATLVIALLAPLLGVLADRKGKKKLFFTSFFVLAAVMFFAMAFIDNYYVLLAVNLLTGIGYAGANIFYDAFLVDVTQDERMDFISSFGYAVGYVGSCIPFIISIILYMTTPFGLDAMSAVKAGILINAVWWVLFTIPMMRRVHQKYYNDKLQGGVMKAAFKQVGHTCRLIAKNKSIGLFLLAYFFYIDGVDTIIKLSTTYGQAVGLDTTGMIIALLVTQLVAFPAVLVFAKVSQRFSTKRVLLWCVVTYVGVCIFGYFLTHQWQFWIMAVVVGIVQGTIQALSRSYFGKLVPKENNNEYFGFYNIFGKYATVIGPALMGLATLLTGNARYGVLSIAVLFVLGFVILLFVPNAETKTDSAA
ncbi:MFS transporter [Massilimaliae timonensis]|uniref:MFS transporter n=1 Tax=Massiliimalia timonensis TaxID=1987501 RepID=A0A8J6U184_9FIRM|nr:MFS transporter [Massiliimalia timonensis]MBC8611967.1 MFS transporter [Massiliimalia timonensis]